MRNFALLVALATGSMTATADPADSHGPLGLELPLIDEPFNTLPGHPLPSMGQSLALTKDFYELTHYGITRYVDPYQRGWSGFFSRLGIATFDVLSFFVPGGEAWMHEEWHRAVMSRNGIASHNGVYDGDHGTLIPVDHVSDMDLERLKATREPDMVRLPAAGMEAEHALALSLEEDRFFLGTEVYQSSILFMAKISPLFYLDECASHAGDKSTDDQNKADGSNVGARDFTGLDCDGWAYDLYRPTEPYGARGPHPSGTGINRYIHYSQLDAPQQAYLRRQTNLSILNLVDPNLVTGRDFDAGHLGLSGMRYNFSLFHDLTSFGSAVGLHLFLRGAAYGLLSSVNVYSNHERSFPGLDVELRGVKLGPAEARVRLAGWEQPKEQEFYTTQGAWGGLASLRLGFDARDSVAPFLELEGKTQGWVAGNVFLDRSFATRLGVEAHVF